MIVLATPRTGRLKFDYPGNLSNLTLSGIIPHVQASQARMLRDALQLVQDAAPERVTLTTETALSQLQ